jgi:cysteine desulfurase
VLLGATEHKSVIAAARALADHHNCETVMIDVDRDGRIDMGALEDWLDSNTLLISIMAVNNEIGTIQDIAQIGALARAVGALFHCDAAQAPCAIDASDLIDHADMISLSGHKIYGPCGIGALIARRDVQPMISPLIHGGGQQNGLRSGTLPLALCVGFGAAAELIGGPDAAEERERIRAIRDLFIQSLIAVGHDIQLNGATGDARHPGNANLLMRGVAAADLLASMQPKLAASSGSACTSGIPEPSHVLRAIGLSADEADSSVRFSFGRQSTEADAREAAAIVSETLGCLSEAGLRAIA